MDVLQQIREGNIERESYGIQKIMDTTQSNNIKTHNQWKRIRETGTSKYSGTWFKKGANKKDSTKVDKKHKWEESWEWGLNRMEFENTLGIKKHKKHGGK